MFDKKTVSISILLVVMMICSPFVWVSNFSSNAIANEEVSRFICLSRQDCDKVLLSWEPVPFAKSYEVRRSGTLVKELPQDFTMCIDSDIQNKQTYNYSIIAKDTNGNIISSSFSIPVSINCPEENDKTVLEFQLDNFIYWVNGESKGPMSTPPVVISGRSFLVIRHITEELSAEISWDGSEKKVTITTRDGKIIELWIGKPNAKIDGEDVYIDEDDHSIVPYISEGRTLLPLRFVSNSLGAKDVLWDGETKKITLIWGSDKSVKHNIQLTIDETSHLTGFDVLGNNYILETVSEDTGLESGDKIISNYVIDNLKDRNDTLTASLSLENINIIEFTNSVVGMVTSNTTDTTPCKITISSGDKEFEFLYELGLDGLESVKSDSWIKITSTDENKISSWEYLRNELHDGLEAHSTEFFYEKQIASQQTLIISTEDILTDNPTPCKVSFISNDLETLKTGICYHLSYKTNWLGRNIVTSIEGLNCQCMMILPEINLRERSVYGGEKREYKFTITNNSRVKKDFECFTFCSSEGGFPGKLRLIKNNISLNPGSSESLTFMLEAEKNAEGSFEIVYGAKCDEVEIKHSFTLDISPNLLDYEVIMPKRLYCPDNLRMFTIPIKIINHSDEPVELVLDVQQNEQEHFNFSPKDLYLGGNSTKEIIVSVSLPPNPRDYKKGSGDSFTVVFSAEDYIKKSKFATTVYIDTAKHPIVDTTISLDKNTDTVTLNTSVDWLLFKPGYVNIDWGDGTTTNKAESFPYKHKYTSSGVFNIEVIANPGGCIGWGYATVVIGNGNKYPDLNNLKVTVDDEKKTCISLTCDVDWNEYSIDDIAIIVRWGNGTRWSSGNKTDTLLTDSLLEYDYRSYVFKPFVEHNIIYVLIVSRRDRNKVLKTYRLDVDIDMR